MSEAPDKMLVDAFWLAHFIHGDRHIALRVAIEAIGQLEIASSAQDKRLNYKPTGRKAGGNESKSHRSKVSMSEQQLLQRLVYIVSEAHEVETENRDKGLRRVDLVIRYLKHLVRITVKRNSFYVSLGVTRLLHNYSTAEAMLVNDLITQDPERLRDDYYYRSRKKVLLSEMIERFSKFIQITQGRRGEERFDSSAVDDADRALVERCLTTFTPWETQCAVPKHFRATSDPLPSLSFDDQNPDREHPIEVNRMHTVLHPTCFVGLVASLDLDHPNERLEIPRFTMTRDSGDDDIDRERMPSHPLTEEELFSARTALAFSAGRRKAASAGWLSVSVDGEERAQIDLNRFDSATIKLEDGDELVQVCSVTKGESTLLASFLVEYGEDGGARESRSSITLEAGQRIEFLTSTDASPFTWNLKVTYHETESLRTAALGGRRWLASLQDRAHALTRRPAMTGALLTAVVLLAIISVALFLNLRQSTAPQQIAVSPSPQPTLNDKQNPLSDSASSRESSTKNGADVSSEKRPNPESVAGTPQSPDVAQNSPRDIETPRVDQQTNAATPLPEAEAELTRSVTAGRAVELVQVKKVSVEVLGSGELVDTLREKLANEIASSNIITYERDASTSDAKLEISIEDQGKGPGRKMVIAARVLNENGQTLWRNRFTLADTRPEAVSNQIIRHLTRTIEQLRRLNPKAPQ